MVNRRWMLSGVVMALAVLAASDAHALRGYTAETGKDTLDAGIQNHRVGDFVLEGVAADKSGANSYRPAATVWPPVAGVGSVLGGVGEVVAGPVVLAGAVVNDAYQLLTMPYRKSERLN